MSKKDSIHLLSNEFSKVVNGHLSPAQLEKVKTINTSGQFPGCCATHDYCDANMLMAKAFENIFKRECDLQNDDDMELFNRSWDRSKANNFKVVDYHFKRMQYNTFLKKYKPKENHLDKFAGYGGLMFETFGKELKFVQEQKGENIWTLIDGEGSKCYIVSGWHYVNRLGYFITENPVPENLDIQILA